MEDVEGDELNELVHKAIYKTEAIDLIPATAKLSALDIKGISYVCLAIHCLTHFFDKFQLFVKINKCGAYFLSKEKQEFLLTKACDYGIIVSQNVSLYIFALDIS